MENITLRRAIIEAARDLNDSGLNRGSSGNVSGRIPGGFLITPSGIPGPDIKPGDIVEMTMEGDYSGVLRPSSEWRFHRDILATRPDVNAIVHTHSTFATTLACLNWGIPAFHYMVAVAGGRDIRCAPYATFGSQELSDYAVAGLKNRKACLLANHGMIVVEHDLKKALVLTVEVESLAEQYWRVRQAGDAVLLDDQEMERVLDKFKSYGPQAQE